jgi:hypothetical protein
MEPKPALKGKPSDIAQVQAALRPCRFNGSNALFERAIMICCAILNAGKAAGILYL